MYYRKDIDGLRGVAVASVVFFHAGVPGFSGGFVGVDIFFVISGFLITSLIARDIRAGRFSALEFYDRRIRRVFPALVAVYLVSIVLALAIALPPDFKRFGESLARSAVFLSNHYFYGGTGYFDPAAYTKPLLHTWSLSIEEQFYVAWPLILSALWWLRSRHLLSAILVTAFFSLALAQLALAMEKQAAAYYLLPMRGWELLLGAGLAVIASRVRVERVAASLLAATGLAAIASAVRIERVAANLLAATGLAIIVGAISWLSPESSFPGLNAIFPCLGAALIIAAGQNGPPAISVVYSNPVMVGLGLISYSLYLWHWPLFAFWQAAHEHLLSPPETAVLLAASLGIATLSYRYVEQPFRKQWLDVSGGKVVAIGAGALGLCAVLGLTIAVMDGFPGRFDARTVEIFTVSREKQASRGCWQADAADKRLPDCVLGASHGTVPPRALLLGDSHAEHYAPALNRLLSDAHLSGQLMSLGGCPALTNVTQYRGGRPWKSKCRRFANEVARRLEASDLQLVLFAARWELYTEPKWDAAADPERPARLVDAIDTATDDRDTSRRVLERTLRRMIDEMRRNGTVVVLLGQVPPFPAAPRDCVARSRLKGQEETSCSVSAELVRERLQFSNSMLKRLADRPGVYAFLPSEVMCDANTCSPFMNGVFMYRGKSHLNVEGGKQLAPLLKRLAPFAHLPALAAISPSDPPPPPVR